MFGHSRMAGPQIPQKRRGIKLINMCPPPILMYGRCKAWQLSIAGGHQVSATFSTRSYGDTGEGSLGLRPSRCFHHLQHAATATSASALSSVGSMCVRHLQHPQSR